MGSRSTQLKKIVVLCIVLWFLMLFGLSRMFFVSDATLNDDGEKIVEKAFGKNVSPEELRKIKLCLGKIERLQQQNDLLQKRLEELKYVILSDYLLTFLPFTSRKLRAPLSFNFRHFFIESQTKPRC